MRLTDFPSKTERSWDVTCRKLQEPSSACLRVPLRTEERQKQKRHIKFSNSAKHLALTLPVSEQPQEFPDTGVNKLDPLLSLS